MDKQSDNTGGGPTEMIGPATRYGMTADDAAARDCAKELQQDHPWLVIFGCYSREYVCFPLFHAPPGLWITAKYPPAAAEKMMKVELLYRVRKGLSE